MKSAKIILLLCVGLLFTSFAFSQQTVQEETTVEEEYLSSVEDVIIRELADTDDRDNKLVSLQYIRGAIEGGRTSPDIIYALESLAGEGISSQSRTNGRLMNNFPDVRAEACELLGQVKTEEAKTILVTKPNIKLTACDTIAYRLFFTDFSERITLFRQHRSRDPQRSREARRPRA